VATAVVVVDISTTSAPLPVVEISEKMVARFVRDMSDFIG
jgi:hypothetical protein